ncbi:dihydroneopterin triphosphate diphosphatase [Flavobacterium sp. W21_SRS_FM6]|uniref:dihydroneopterin triphosphate diphosphatase n=1 Tax=Flavobacterium sp. W21_SRS_FM6 TaxID=3240268 RepID=UPI003F919AB5
MSSQWRIPESALIVIYNMAGQVLVLQRNDDPLFWQSVTGTREQGESPLQTAIREVREETGIDITASNYQLVDCKQTNQYEIRSRWRHRYPPDVSTNTEYVFSVQVVNDQQIILTEHSAFSWLPKAQAIEKVWSETNKAAIERFVPKVVDNDDMSE